MPVSWVPTAALALACGSLPLPVAAAKEVCPSGLRCNRTAEDRHHWPRAKGHVGSYGRTPLKAPESLTASHAWSWHHPAGQYHDCLLGGPNIDEHKNLYVPGTTAITKLSPDGKVLWTFRRAWPREWFVHNIALMGDALYANLMRLETDGNRSSRVFAVSLDTGKQLWETRIPVVGTDTAYVEVHDGIVISACSGDPIHGGSYGFIALNASDGEVLWKTDVDQTLWNFMPMFPDDGTFLVMDIHGGVYRFSMDDGKRLWYTPPPKAYAESFSDGYVSLGPDGTAFTCSAHALGKWGSKGALRAYRVDTGALLWDTTLSQPCISWAVSDGETVYVPHGPFPETPMSVGVERVRWMPLKFKGLFHDVEMFAPEWLKRFLFNSLFGGYPGPKQSEVWALNAKTGTVRWKYLAPLYDVLWAKGDMEGLMDRWQVLRPRLICLPAAWGSPILTGEGTVHVGNMDGWVYSIRDANGDGRIDPETEVSRFNAGGSFLHFGPALAPGMMGIATCDTLHVFKY